MKVLLVEDDRKLALFLQRALEEEGFIVDACRSGLLALEQARSIAYDIVVLDWMLPEKDGLSVCRELRASGSAVPILMLTARGEVAERVTALDAGADDYVVKPFHLDELLARVRAVGRRASGQKTDRLTVGPLVLDLREHAAFVNGAKLDLTQRELSLLTLLAKNAGRVVTRTEILSQVWNTARDPESNVIEVNVRNLREKLGEGAALLETVRGQGYRLSAGDAA